MKKLLPFLFLMSAPAYADMTSKFTSSIAIKVDAAMTQATRIGAQYSASGTNIGTSDTDGVLGGLSVDGGVVSFDSGSYSINGCSDTTPDCADSFAFTESYLTPDTIPSNNGTENVTITAGTVPNFGSVISTAAGDGDGADFDAFSNHEIDGLSVGGPGSTVTGQFVTEITVR